MSAQNNVYSPPLHSQNQDSDNSYYYQNPPHSQYSQQDTPLSKNQNSIRDASSMSKPESVIQIKYEKPKSRWLPCFPCIRSTCGRVTCCFCLILLLVIIVLVIVFFTVFKMPTVDYQGTKGDPDYMFNDGLTTFGVDLIANIQVQNPNPIGFKFESIVATAYYPDYEPTIGGGNITNVNFPSKSTKTIQFPIAAKYDRRQDPGFTVIQSILTKCGLTGTSDGQITINYDLKLTLKIIGISIRPTIKNQSANFPCPANIGDIAMDIPGGIGAIIDILG
ncbi:hypothetical protein BG011_000182 [Mortierella polycephala]|uniref:Late embryogenesis abundant protein LEA-2 subgroup domain-containing protein n=1 Tax=Mortierella polycephala TaxID=41804 RepID=A0A9P6TVT5_9FUNG|nr:hypothetical protein BG011_000182 [Mortierella polycephala]